MKKKFYLFSMLVAIFATGCPTDDTNEENDPSVPTPSTDPLNTARNLETRTSGLESDFPNHDAVWPPDEIISISFPATMMTPGAAGLNGEGTVTETKWSQLEKDILYEINKFRRDPVAWCNENGLPMLDGLTAQEEFSTGPRAGNYSFPAQILNPSQGLHKAALHQTARGAMAHSDGSRVRWYVTYSGWGENVGWYDACIGQASGGASNAAKVVNEFIRDRGVSDKGHRINIADPRWNCAGIAAYKNLIVMQFGYGVRDVR